MPIEPFNHDHWESSLTSTLKDLVPLELLHETIDSLLSSIRHSGISVEESDVHLSLDEMDSHPLTGLLTDQLAPVMDPSTSWSFIASTVLEGYIHQQTTDTDVRDGQGRQQMPGRRRVKVTECELCGRSMPLTVHHLIPRSTHTYFTKHPTQLLPDVQVHADTAKKSDLALLQAMLCRPCHSQIHALVPDHREMGREYASVDKLLQRDDVRRWVGYISSQRGSDRAMGPGIRYRR